MRFLQEVMESPMEEVRHSKKRDLGPGRPGFGSQFCYSGLCDLGQVASPRLA